VCSSDLHFADDSEEQVLANYGMLLWGNSNYNYNEATMGYHENGKSDFSWGYYGKRSWSQPHLVTYMESHDEERLMFKNLQYGNGAGAYSVKDPATALNRIKLAGAFFLTLPGPKMLWQFGELGYDPAAIAEAVAATEAGLGPISILVNNAGIVVDKPMLETEEADWDRVLDTNLKGAWLMAREVAGRMAKAGGGGRIINIASILGQTATGRVHGYAASKAALIHLTRTLAVELARYGIRVNAIAPGYVETDLNRDFLAGPVLGGEIRAFVRLTKGNIDRLLAGEETRFGRDFVRFLKLMTPGWKLFYTRLAFERMIFDEIQKLLDPDAAESFRRVEQFAKRKFDQRYFSRPGRGFPPERFPELETALGGR